MKIKIRPIDIKIKDNWRYGEIAFLVDRDDFLEDIIEARKRLGLSTFIPHKEILEVEWTSLSLSQADKLSPIVEKLRKKYKKTHHFYLVIEAAILCGVVADGDFMRTYCTIIFPGDDDFFFTSEPHLAIIFTPETKLKEIIASFKKEAAGGKKSYKEFVLKTKRTTQDTISNIKRDRKWYWMKKNGLSYSQIHKQATEKGKEAITRDGIIKAIKQYKERLGVEL